MRLLALILVAATWSFAGSQHQVEAVPHLNGTIQAVTPALGLPALDASAVQALSAAGADLKVTWDGSKGTIELAPQAGAALQSASIQISSLDELKSGVSEITAALKNEGAGGDVSASLTKFFENGVAAGLVDAPASPLLAQNVASRPSGLTAAASRATVSRGEPPAPAGSIDPIARTMRAMAASLPELVPTKADPDAVARQKAALTAWQNSAKKTYVIINSYSFKDDGTPGLGYYDERGLAQILWAAEKGVDVVYVTARPVEPAVIRHILGDRRGAAEILKRVHLFSLDDFGNDFLTQKMLDAKHADKMSELKALLGKIGSPAALYPYMAGPYEWEIAKRLGIPDSLYGSHLTLSYWGTKSGGNHIFEDVLKTYSGTPQVRVRMAAGRGDIYDLDGALAAVNELLAQDPKMPRVAARLNLGSSGEGNMFPAIAALAPMNQTQRRAALEKILKDKPIGIPDPKTGRIDSFKDVMESEGTVIQGFIPNIDKGTFPSVQSVIEPDGTVRVVSSHEQNLIDNNTYIGARYKANEAYRAVIEKAALEVAKRLAAKGVIGRFGTDFAAVPDGKGGYDVWLIENNIRITGTTYPLVTTMNLTGAKYDKKGVLRLPDGTEPAYEALDHDSRKNLIGISVDQFLGYMERPENNDVLFDRRKQEGALFHLLPAIKYVGNVGYTLIARSVKQVEALKKRMALTLDRLEVENLTGYSMKNSPYKVSRVDIDRRLRVEQTTGHHKQAELFSHYLKAHPDLEFTRKKGHGVIFHPVGYTVVSKDPKELASLRTQARAFFADFEASVSH